LNRHLDIVASLALGAALAFWFSHYVWGSERAVNAAFVMSLVWIPAVFLKFWIDRKAANG
jgi:hypothetical protein